MTAQFMVLGDIAVRVDGRPLDIGHMRQRCVLAALLVDANRTVSVDQLADRIWADRLPQRFRSTLYSYLSRLRQALILVEGAGARIGKEPGGYQLTVDASAVDLHRFRRLVAQARTAEDGERAVALFEKALGLWRAEPFANLDTPWFSALRETLVRERLAAELDRYDLVLRQGRHGELLAELTTWAEARPMDERLAGQLMLALYRSGRAADALGHYRRTRERLTAELGVDPGAPLRELHQRILTADPSLDPPYSPLAVASPMPVPRQLPAPPGAFTGRSKELDQAADRLDALDIGDLTASLRAAFAASHRVLTSPAGTMFVLLGLAPGPDISLAAAASLAALPTARARALLAELESAHLVRQDRPGRYWMHDLVRLYATELAHQQPGQDKVAALTRLVDFYVHTAYAANRLLDGPNTPFDVRLESPVPGCSPLTPADTTAALRWFDEEHACLLAVQSLALATGRHPQVWQLAWSLISYHQGGYHLTEYLTVWRAALTATERQGDTPTPRALAHWRYGHARSLTGDHGEALDQLGQALTLAERTDDTAGQAHICRTLGRVWEQYGDDERALEDALRSLALYLQLDNPLWQANQLNAVGWMHAQLGRYPQARTHCEQALLLYREHGRPADAASALDSLGYIAHHTGQHAQALEYYQQALAVLSGEVVDG
ncbi:BTAD domain-containing putative transcriptional regulator [Streptomyces sp. NPDC059837]|uniref:AfsR/SARP family transcriptional regulator n=1 Tax=Streptomyces sp. NPDC059837 TaxID=3346968 RepID=UPI00365D4E98